MDALKTMAGGAAAASHKFKHLNHLHQSVRPSLVDNSEYVTSERSLDFVEWRDEPGPSQFSVQISESFGLMF